MTTCTCDPVPMTAGGEGPSETCEIHGRPYREWVERGDILNARLEAVKAVIAKARRTPVANDPYRVALDIADDLEAAVYLDTLPNARWGGPGAGVARSCTDDETGSQ